MRSVREIILELGGASKVAQAHRPPLAQSTVDSWMRSNYVPEWRQPDLRKVAAKAGKPLTDNDFPRKEQRSKVIDG